MADGKISFPFGVTPSDCKSKTVTSEIATGSVFGKNCVAIKAPNTAPPRKTKFHNWSFQLKLKKSEKLPAPQAAQMVRIDEEAEKLFPK